MSSDSLSPNPPKNIVHESTDYISCKLCFK